LSNNANNEERDDLSIANTIKDYVASLHPIEKSILSTLYYNEGKWITDDELIKKSDLYIDQIRRGVEWLKFKNFIAIDDGTEFEISLKKSISHKDGFLLPERKLVNCIKQGKSDINDIIKSTAFNNNTNEAFSAIKYCKNNRWIVLKDKSISLLPQAEYLSNEEKLVEKLIKSNSLFLSKLSASDFSSFEILKKRPNVLDIKKVSSKKYKITDLGITIFKELNSEIRLERKLTAEHLINGKWRNLHYEQIDVEAPLPLLGYGKKNPLVDFIDEVKEILIGMGFSEIEGNFVQSSFWNFDALFIPQDHSARDMQDTFYLSCLKDVVSLLPNDDIIKNVSMIHEQNWNYSWNIEDSKPYVLRTHTTPVTLQYLAKGKPEQDKTFLIGRVFRNEKASFKHLVEFNQVEGIFTSKDANMRQLMDIQTEFYVKLGIKKIKFWPTFFPYTEPSLQSMVYNEKFDKWIELFGMGILRPEVTMPLGIKNPVLAWGGGFERLAMIRFNLDDIRELYSNNLAWLKGVPKCLL
jgi:phenylalanyl-tRNA synthetase alpha chain